MVRGGPDNGNFCLTMDSIRRIKKLNNFTAVNNEFIRDEKLSWKAKGIIIYLLSLPDDWNLHLSELANHAKDGRDATNNGIKELIENGYCRRTEVRDTNGTFAGYNYEISDTKDFQPQTESPQEEKPQTENPFTDNPQLPNTNSNKELTKPNTDITNNIKNIDKKKPKNFVKPTLEQVKTYVTLNGYVMDAEQFYDYYESNGWKVGKSPMISWEAAIRNWVRNEKKYNNNGIYQQQRQDRRREGPVSDWANVKPEDLHF